MCMPTITDAIRYIAIVSDTKKPSSWFGEEEGGEGGEGEGGSWSLQT